MMKKKINFQMLNNIKNINNNSIIKDLDIIINEENIVNKLLI